MIFAKNQAETCRIETKRIHERYRIKKQLLREQKEKISSRNGSKRISALRLSKSKFRNSYLKESSCSRSRDSNNSSQRKVNYTAFGSKMGKLMPSFREKFAKKYKKR